MKKALLFWQEVPVTVPDTSTDVSQYLRIEALGADFALLSCYNKVLMVYQVLDIKNPQTDDKQSFILTSDSDHDLMLEADQILENQFNFTLLDSRYNNLL